MEERTIEAGTIEEKIYDEFVNSDWEYHDEDMEEEEWD